MKSNPISDQFRHSMSLLESYAIEMNDSILSKYNSQLKIYESIKQKGPEKITIRKFQYDGAPIDPDPPLMFDNPNFVQQQNEYERKKKEFDDWLHSLSEEENIEYFSQLEEFEEEEERPFTEEELESHEIELMDLDYKLDELRSNYHSVLFESLFVALYSRFEQYLIDLCEFVRDNESLSLKRSDSYRQGIPSAAKYLKKVARLNFPDNTKRWQIIQLLRKIRNLLVHDPEKIDNFTKNNPILLNYLWKHDKSWDDLKINSFMISLESIKKIIETMTGFSLQLDETLKEHDNLRRKFQHGPKRKK